MHPTHSLSIHFFHRVLSIPPVLKLNKSKTCTEQHRQQVSCNIPPTCPHWSGMKQGHYESVVLKIWQHMHADWAFYDTWKCGHRATMDLQSHHNPRELATHFHSTRSLWICDSSEVPNLLSECVKQLSMHPLIKTVILCTSRAYIPAFHSTDLHNRVWHRMHHTTLTNGDCRMFAILTVKQNCRSQKLHLHIHLSLLSG